MNKHTYIAILAGILLNSSIACCCSCDPTPAFETAVTRADLIATGTVVDAETLQPSAKRAIQGVESRLHELGLFWKPTKPRLSVPYKLSVNRIWKGSAPQTVRVFSGFGAADCGALQVGRSYLVYANRDATGDYFTHACMRTRELALAAVDLGQLGPGIGVRSSPQPARPTTALLVALALILAAGGAVLWRRWRVA